MLNFGIKVHKGNNIYENIRTAKMAEKLGFTNCWITEDYFYPGVFSIASACAINTNRIKIGTGVINPFTRHPALSAMEFGSFDIIAKGRGILGIGASSKKWIEEEIGIPYHRPLKTLIESFYIIKELFRKGEIKYLGEIFSTGKIKLCFTPYRKNIPIFFGVKGPKALKLAAKNADGVLLSMMTSIDYIKYVRKQIYEELLIRKKLEKFKIAAYIIINISKDRKIAREQVKPLISRYLGIYGVHPILTSSGIKEDEIIPFREAFLKKKNASNLVHDKLIDKFAIAGNEYECKEKIISLIESGIDYPIISEIPGVLPDYTMKYISNNFIK